MMQDKEFRQSTVREAFQAIRDEFGPDALVLSSELVNRRGWRGWVGMREVRVTARAPEGWAPTPERRPAEPQRRPTDTIPPVSSLAAQLTAAGLDGDLADVVAAAVPAKQQRGLTPEQVRGHLAAHLAPMAAGSESFARVEVFVGPPGVGKTTTIAKIAAQERVRKKRALAVVSADAFRAGAVEQLRTYAAIIGAPFRAARTIEEMDQAIGAARQTLLVDTAGRSPNDDDIRDVRKMLGRRDGVRTHLVLPADTSLPSAKRIVARFADTRPDRIVVSRLDESESPTALFTWLLQAGLPVSYVTTGQRVPEDLTRATPEVLASVMLGDGWTAAPVPAA
jgi:flagellar biosynthesis protein FlhF